MEDGTISQEEFERLEVRDGVVWDDTKSVYEVTDSGDVYMRGAAYPQILEGYALNITARCKTAKDSFDEWMKKADDICWERHGVSIHDLPDCSYYDWYDSGVSPKGAVSRAYKSAKEDGY